MRERERHGGLEKHSDALYCFLFQFLDSSSYQFSGCKGDKDSDREMESVFFSGKNVCCLLGNLMMNRI